MSKRQMPRLTVRFGAMNNEALFMGVKIDLGSMSKFRKNKEISSISSTLVQQGVIRKEAEANA